MLFKLFLVRLSLHLGLVHRSLGGLRLFQIVAVELNRSRNDLSLSVIRTLDLNSEPRNERSHGHLLSSGLEESANLRDLGVIGEHERQLCTAAELDDHFVAASTNDEAFDLYVLGDDERTENHEREIRTAHTRR